MKSIRRTFPRVAPLAAAIAVAAFAGSVPAQADAPTAADRYRLRMDLRQDRTQGRMPAPAPRTVPQQPAATWPVTSCADDGSAGTLRAALQAAGETDTIDLTALTCSTITLTGGPLDIGVLGDHQINDLTVLGPGRDALTIDGNGDRVFLHGDFRIGLGTLAISDLTIRNGNYTHGLASCIDSSGNITLTNVTITDCHASGGSPMTFGGALSVSGTLTMQSSTISDSSSTAGGNAVASGGGAYVAGDAVLVDSTISGNRITAVSGGDGFYITGGGGLYVRGSLTLTRSTISGNTVTASGADQAGIAGGVFLRDTSVFDSSTVSGNEADGDGGGVFKAKFSNYGDPPGGTRLTIANSTVSGNRGARGAGVLSERELIVANSTLTANAASVGGGGLVFRADDIAAVTFTFDSSIVFGNTAPTGGLSADLAATEGGLTVAGAHNLIGEAGTLTLPGDTLAGDPLLQPLAANGGPTQTHALGEGSPAIDAGANPNAYPYDQRGEGHPRVAGAAADIGAFEVPAGDLIFRDGFEAPVTSVTYLYDDGDGDTNQGPPSTFDPDMLWGNYYLTEAGAEVITEISIAFGPTFPSLANGPVTFWLLDDPDADLDPRNAVALTSVQATPDVFNDTFFTVKIPPTRVSGAFFVGASAKLDGGQDKPARVDRDASGDKSWFFYAPEIADVIDDLASAPFGTRNDNTQFVVLPGTFMVRAKGIPAE